VAALSAIGVSVTVTAGIAVADAASSPDGDRVPQPPAARVWVTTPDGALRLSDQGAVPFATRAPTALTVTVDPHRTYQTMEGFGASITDSSAAVLYRLNAADRNRVMKILFDARTGNALSYLRQPMGASDFVVDHHYTYNDLPAGKTDYQMRRFSIAHDERQILPLLRQARRLNPQLRIMASPWSPPAWMKTSRSLIGGRLIDDPRIYQAYALYFVKFIQAYARAGVPVDAVTVQNEPQNREPDGYPGMDLPVASQKKLIQALGPALRSAGLKTKIIAYDHNWSMHPDDVASTPPGEAPEINYAAEVLADAAVSQWVAGTAYHCYYGDPLAQGQQRTRYPTKDIYFTECSGIRSTQPANTFSDTLKWHARNLIIGTTRNWAKTMVNWNLVLDHRGGPHVGGCAVCTGVLTVGPGDKVQPNAEYYTLGQASRFVRPGAVRIASTSFGTTGWNGQIMDAAFRNADGSTALIVHNQNDAPRTFAVAVGRYSFTYTLPGGALATFTWPHSPLLQPDARALDPAAWSASAKPAAPADPCCAGDVAANAVDDDASTRWSTGTGQRSGQHLQIDLGRRTTVSRLVLDTGASAGDYPRGYRVSVSDDGRRWSRPVATGAGSGQLTTIPLAITATRYLRVTLTEESGSWWSVADVRAYR
jgi:glucosylceramidase